MKIPILIEPLPGDRYRATASEPFVGRVEAETPDAALAKLRALIADRLARGARIAEIELPQEPNPWLEGAAMLRDGPLFDNWQRAIAAYRRDSNQPAAAPW